MTKERDSRPEPKEQHPSINYQKVDCINCHKNNGGKDWKEVTFDHKKHFPKPNTCNNCHDISRPVSHVLNPTTKGMDKAECNECHQSFKAWNEKIIKFDHSNSSPKKCSVCHESDAKKVADFHPSAKENFAKLDCYLCHTYSENQGKLSFKNITFNHINHSPENLNCQNCHLINNNSLPKNGGHRSGSRKNSNCNECHEFSKTVAWKNFRPFNHFKLENNEECLSCHNSTNTFLKYKNEFHVRASNKCEECHLTTTFKTNKFIHLEEDKNCSTCHNGKTAKGRPASHGLRSDNHCQECHIQKSWSQIVYNNNYSHDDSDNLIIKNYGRFNLKHTKLSKCQMCHELKSDNYIKKFKNYEKTCNSCHYDKFQDSYHEGRETTEIKNCIKCHTFENWDVKN